MPDLWMDVDAALSEVPVNILPLLDDTDFKSREVAIAYDAAGMDLVWNFVTTAGAYTQTAVTPTTGGNYDWAHQGDGMYSIEIPASGGASINNDTEGFGWFTGFVTGVLPWRGPTIGFRAAALNNSMVDGTTIDVNVTAMAAGTITAAAIATGAIDADAIADNAIDAGAIAADAITSAKIATDAIGAAQIAANAIGSSEIADGAITAAKIATDAIDADALADGAITAATFAAGAIDNTAFNVTETLSADVVSISGDTTAADNLEKEYDGTGYGHVLQRTTIATLASQTSFTLTAGSADNDAYNGCVIVIEDASTAAQKAVGVISDYTGASKTITLLNDPAVFTMATTDIVTIIADRALKATVDNRTLDVSATGEAGLDWANIGSPTTAQNLSATNIDVDQIVASVSGAVGSVGAGGITAASIATGAIDADSLAADAGTEIGTAVWASADRQLTALDEDVTTLDLNNTAIGSVVSGVTVTTNNDKTGYALSAAGVQAIWDALTAALTTVGSIGKLLVDNINATISSRSSHSAADVWAVATRLLTAGTNIVLAKGVGVTGFNDLSAADVRTAVGLASANLDTQLGDLPTAAENADAVWDEARSGHSTQGTYGESFFSIESGSAVAGTLSTTQMTTNLTEATDDHYNGRIIIWVSGTLTRQATDITNYDGATKRLDYTAVTEAPLAGDRFIIV